MTKTKTNRFKNKAKRVWRFHEHWADALNGDVYSFKSDERADGTRASLKWYVVAVDDYWQVPEPEHAVFESGFAAAQRAQKAISDWLFGETSSDSPQLGPTRQEYVPGLGWTWEHGPELIDPEKHEPFPRFSTAHHSGVALDPEDYDQEGRP